MSNLSFISGLPENVYVGQTKINTANALNCDNLNLAGLNLALHVNDEPARVHQHRMLLLQEFKKYGVEQLIWLNQTHSTICHRVERQFNFSALEGDGLVTENKKQALMIMTADCLPIVLVNKDGTEIGNLHAGWRGLAEGIVENTIQEMRTSAHYAYLGAAISSKCFEVGQEVKARFLQRYDDLESAFLPSEQPNKFFADLYEIAKFILMKNGVQVILGGEECTYLQEQDYYSYRRNSKSGRMATFVFIGD